MSMKPERAMLLPRLTKTAPFALRLFAGNWPADGSLSGREDNPVATGYPSKSRKPGACMATIWAGLRIACVRIHESA
jgi:hypothetical protein